MTPGFVEGTYLAWLDKKPRMLGRMWRAISAGMFTRSKLGRGFWPSRYVEAARCQTCRIVIFSDQTTDLGQPTIT
jgi:hypothetical protein